MCSGRGAGLETKYPLLISLFTSPERLQTDSGNRTQCHWPASARRCASVAGGMRPVHPRLRIERSGDLNLASYGGRDVSGWMEGSILDRGEMGHSIRA